MKYEKKGNYLGSCIVSQNLMTPSPPLPLEGKGDQPHKRLQSQCGGILPLSQGGVRGGLG